MISEFGVVIAAYRYVDAKSVILNPRAAACVFSSLWTRSSIFMFFMVGAVKRFFCFKISCVKDLNMVLSFL